MDRSHRQSMERTKSGVKAFVEWIAVCGKQNFPKRRLTDHRSNYATFLEYRAKRDAALREYLQLAPANANHCSHRIPNEFMELYGKQILDDFLEKCRNAKWFSVLVDKTADISNLEHVALVVRYVDTSKGLHTVWEDFLRFVASADTTGETLAQLILGYVKRFNLNPDNLVG